ncbi:hypothetical protein C0J52_02408, partial [Blattella germanica]
VNTFCALAGEKTLSVSNIERSGKCCVAKIDWLLRSISSKQLLSWSPADLMFATMEIEQELSSQYDEFGDSYTQPATKESLRYSLEQVEKKGCAVELTEGMKADLEIELFSGPSPFAMFRLCTAYVDKFNKLNDVSSGKSSILDIVELDFCFYGGVTCTEIDSSTTHVILHTGSMQRLQEIKDLNRVRSKKYYIISEQWVLDTVRDHIRHQEHDYFL